MTNLSNTVLKKLSSCLRIEAITDTYRGITTNFIPIGTIGYILGHDQKNESYLIHWDIKKQYKDDWRVSSHKISDLKILGRGVDNSNDMN